MIMAIVIVLIVSILSLAACCLFFRGCHEGKSQKSDL